MAAKVRRIPQNLNPIINRPYTWATEQSEMQQRGTPKPKMKNIELFSNLICYGFGLTNSGIMNSKMGSPHSSGRACDFSDQAHGSNFEQSHWNLMNFLYMYRYDLHIEEIHDYQGIYIDGAMRKYKRNRGSSNHYSSGYRCNREKNANSLFPDMDHELSKPGWIRYGPDAPAGILSHLNNPHVHVELSPQLASYSEAALTKRVWDRVVSYFTYDYRTIYFVGRNENCVVRTINPNAGR